MNSARSRTWSVTVASCALLLFSASGCSKVDRAEWREEVELATGEIVVVKRAAARLKSGFPVSPRGATLEERTTFPDNRTVWTNDGNMHAVAIELRDGKAYVAVNIRSRELCKKHSDPPASTIFFRRDGESWIQIRKEEFPPNGKANVLVSPWGRTSSEDASGLIRNKDKHLAKPYNNGVNQPLEKVLADRSLDACDMFKREGIKKVIERKSG